MNKPSRLEHELFLGNFGVATNHAMLHAYGITAVVNLTPDDNGCSPAGFKTLHLEIEDAHLVPNDTVALFLRQMDAWHTSNEVVLIHCHMGISRTAAFAIAWLMHRVGCYAGSDLRSEWGRAEDRVREARGFASPHYNLKDSVMRYFESLPGPCGRTAGVKASAVHRSR